MRIYYDRSVVTGHAGEDGGGRVISEEIIHRREQNPILLAVKRNNALAGCGRISAETVPAFSQWVDEAPHRTKADIPRQEGRDEYEYEGF